MECPRVLDFSFFATSVYPSAVSCTELGDDGVEIVGVEVNLASALSHDSAEPLRNLVDRIKPLLGGVFTDLSKVFVRIYNPLPREESILSHPHQVDFYGDEQVVVIDAWETANNILEDITLATKSYEPKIDEPFNPKKLLEKFSIFSMDKINTTSLSRLKVEIYTVLEEARSEGIISEDFLDRLFEIINHQFLIFDLSHAVVSQIFPYPLTLADSDV